MENLKKRAHFLLRRSERFFKTDMVYLIQGGFWLNSNQMSEAILGLLLTVAFANLIPLAVYGTYKYVLSVYSLFVIASLPGLSTALVRSISRGRDGAFIQGIKLKLNWSLVASLLALTFAAYKYLNGGGNLFALFVVVAVALPLMEAFSMYSSYLNGKRLFKTWTLVDIFLQIFSIGSLILILFFTENIYYILAGYFLPQIIGRALATLYVYLKFKPQGPTDAELYDYSKSLTLYQITTRILSSLDQIAIFHFLGPAQVAIYSLAMAIPSRIQSIFRSTGTLAFPKFFGKSQEESVRSLPKKMLWLSLGIVLVCLAYFFSAPYIFPYIFPQYSESLPYSRIIVFFSLSAVTYPFSTYLVAHKKIKEGYIFSLSNLVVKLACLFFLVPVFGIWGAVIGTLATAVTTIVICFLLLNQEIIKFSSQLQKE